MIVIIGNNEMRKLIVEKLQYCLLGSVIHASAIISPYAQIGEGTVIIQNAVINSCSQMGETLYYQYFGKYRSRMYDSRLCVCFP